MLKTYDTATNAFVERESKIYDETAGAWTEAPSVKTYDATLNAWVERLYQYFVLEGYRFNNGGSYEPNSDGVGVKVCVVTEGFNDSCTMAWSGEDIVNPVLTCNYFQSGTPDSVAWVVNPTVTFKYQGQTVYSRKLKEENVNGYYSGPTEMSYTGTIDEIEIFCSPVLTGITNPFYMGITDLKVNGKKFRFK